MYFPGGYGPGQDPFDGALASITIRALEDAGAFVVPVAGDVVATLDTWRAMAEAIIAFAGRH
jgi:hypothetical protein